MTPSKYKKIIFITIFTAIVLWGIAVTTDYQLWKMEKEPFFAIRDDCITDVNLYRGLGYHIIGGAWDPDWTSDKEPPHFGYSFVWGW